MENVAELKVYGSSVIELDGAVAQLGEHLLCKQGVSGSIPLSSTIFCPDAVAAYAAALRTGRGTIRVVLWTCLVAYGILSSEENKSLQRSNECCLF